jgi:hypothetical protein
MGSGSSAPLFINENQGTLFKKDPKYGIGFSRSMFSSKEWTTLQKFSKEHYIYQTDLNIVFKRYLSGPDSILRRMRVSINDLKQSFADQILIIREICDVFLPQIFHKDFDGLDPPFAVDEISFARFALLGYLFCAQPFQDVIYDLFSIAKRNLNIKIGTIIYTYNIQQISLLLGEEMVKPASLIYAQKKCNIKNEMEVSIETVMLYAVKYPIIFFRLELFRKVFRRQLFGDKFWRSQQPLPSRFDIISREEYFCTISIAGRESARAIVLDYEENTPLTLITSARRKLENEEDFIVNAQICHRMKADLGYRLARNVILESGFQYDQSEKFMSLPVDEIKEQRIYDPKIKREFVYNAGTGFRSWIDLFRDRDGRVRKEVAFRSDVSHLLREGGGGGGASGAASSEPSEDGSDDESNVSGSESQSTRPSSRHTKKSKVSVKKSVNLSVFATPASPAR